MALGLLAQGDTSAAISELKSAVELDPSLVQADLLLVLSYIRRGEYEKAVAAAQDLERRRPEDPVAYNLTGLAFKAKGESAKARERFRKALDLDPGFSVAGLNLARMARADNDPDAAEKDYRGVLEHDPANLTALVGMLTLAGSRGDQEAFEKWLERAVDRRPGAVQIGVIHARYLMAQGEMDKALAVATELSQAHPSNPAVLEVLGRAQLGAGRAAIAAQTLSALVERRPDSAEAHYLLGASEAAAGNTAAAREQLETAVALDPDHMAARVALAELALKADEGEQALLIGERLREDVPDQAVGYEVSGAALLRLDRPDDALAMYEKAQALRPTANTALILATLYGRLDRPAEARGVLETWLAEHPEDVNVLRQLAMLHLREGHSEEAIGRYEQVARLSPDDSLALNNLAWLYFETGDDRALATAEKAYQLDPNKPEVLDTYGWILLQKGQLSPALNILQQAMLNAPHNPEIAFHTASAMGEAGRIDDARRLLRRLVGEHPQSDYAAKAQALLNDL
jgi:putative PEP-CTERM system TPR-repeat lipoprotein